VPTGATEVELDAIEDALDVRLTTEHRALLAEQNGFERWHGGVYLAIYGTESLVAVNRELERLPGIVAFGSDGARELIGFDLRASPPPVVMIDVPQRGGRRRCTRPNLWPRS
jgi:hypothetical protein